MKCRDITEQLLKAALNTKQFYWICHAWCTLITTVDNVDVCGSNGRGFEARKQTVINYFFRLIKPLWHALFVFSQYNGSLCGKVSSCIGRMPFERANTHVSRITDTRTRTCILLKSMWNYKFTPFPLVWCQKRYAARPTVACRGLVFQNKTASSQFSFAWWNQYSYYPHYYVVIYLH